MVIVTSSVDEKLSVTADSGMSRNAGQRWAGAGAWSPECGPGSGSGDGIRGEQIMTWRAETRHNTYYEMVLSRVQRSSPLLRPVVI